MMKTSRLQPQLKQLELACGDDKQKYQMEVQQLYKDEGVSMFGGCLWSLLPLLIIWPLYSVIREPLTYLLHMSAAEVETVKTAAEALLEEGKSLSAYWQYAEAAKLGINFSFCGIDLGLQPSWQIWNMVTWAEIGGALIPLISGALNWLSMFVSQKMNNTVITDKNGERDEAAAEKAAQTNKTMTVMMPIMSIVFGFMMPLGLSIYWIAQSAFGIVQDYFLTKHYRKVYDAEDEIKRQKAAERAQEEAEKERIRAAKRAANPNGIVENTSKKKQQLREKQDRESAAKEYEAKKRAAQGLPPIEESELPAGGEEHRPYARGRAYQADRYTRENKE